MEDTEMICTSSSNGWQSYHNYFQCIKFHLVYTGIWNPSIKDEMNFHWDLANIDDQCHVFMWNTCKEIERRIIFVSWNAVLSSAAYFHYALRFLLRFTWGLRAGKCPCHVFAGCHYGTWRYIDKDNLPCRVVKVAPYKDRQLRIILLNRHTCSCYNRTVHVRKLLKSRLC